MGYFQISLVALMALQSGLLFALANNLFTMAKTHEAKAEATRKFIKEIEKSIEKTKAMQAELKVLRQAKG